MHPSCLEAHTTPRHESSDHAPCNPPTTTRKHPLTPLTAPGSPVVPYSENGHAHQTEERTERVPRELENTKNCWRGPASTMSLKGGDFEEGILRSQGCTHRSLSRSRRFAPRAAYAACYALAQEGKRHLFIKQSR